MRPKKPACHTCEILTGRTIMQFFTNAWFCDALKKPDNFCNSQSHHLTFQILTKLRPAFPRYVSSKISRVSLFFLFFFSSGCDSYHKTQMYHPIALKFSTQKGRIRVHCDAKFGCYTINSHKVIKDYSWKITLLCRHTYRANCLWQDAENWDYQILYMKEIELKIMKILAWVTIVQSKFTDKNRLLTKNNTNMLSHPQDKPLMARSWGDREAIKL